MSPHPSAKSNGFPLSREQYIGLLHDECRRRGLIEWSNHVTASDVATAMGSLEDWDVEARLGIKNFTELTPHEWTDIENFPGSIKVAKIMWKNGSADHSGLEEMELRAYVDRERKEILERWACKHINDIEVATHEHYLELGGNDSGWQSIKGKNPVNTILHWLAATWDLEMAVKSNQEKENENTARSGLNIREQKQPFTYTPEEERLELIIMGDMPETDIATHNHFFIPRDLTFAGFKSQIASFPFIRHFVRIHSPELAATLFSMAYPQGHFDGTATAISPEILEPHANNEGLGRGWSFHIADCPNRDRPVGTEPPVQRQSVVVDTEEEWERMKRMVAASRGEKTAYLLHNSVQDRIIFVERVLKEAWPTTDKRELAGVVSLDGPSDQRGVSGGDAQGQNHPRFRAWSSLTD